MKKAIVLSAFCLILVLFLASAVSAAAGITIDDIKLGDNRQERSVPEAQEVEKQHVRTPGVPLAVTNSGTVNLINVQLKVKQPVVYRTAYDFEIHFDNTDIEVLSYTVPLGNDNVLTVGETANVVVSAEVVADLDAVNANLDEAAQKIAVLEVTAAQELAPDITAIDTADLSMQAENKLNIENIEVCISSEECDANINDGDSFRDVKPGDQVDIEVKAKNKFSDNRNSRVDINNVIVRLDIDEQDIDESLDEDLDDLSPRDEDTVKFDIDIDENADGNANVIIEVEGETEFGAHMGERIDFDLDVNRESHEIKIKSASVNPSAVSCGSADSVTVRVEAQNIGSNNENEVSFKLSSERLGITEQFIRNIELDEDDRISRSFTFTVPGSLRAGVYALLVESFYDQNEFSDSKEVTLTVPECGNDDFGSDFEDQQEDRTRDDEEDTQDEDEQKDRPVVVIQQPPQPPVVTQPPVVSAQPQPAPRKTTSGNSGVIVGVLVGLIVLLLIVGIILVVAIATKKPRY